MANNDKIWIDFGVRENVTKTINDILQKAEDLQQKMSGLMLTKDAIENAHSIEEALDKIQVARRRIADTKLLTTDRDDINELNRMDKAIAKIQKRYEKLAAMGDDTQKAMMGTKGAANLIKLASGLCIALDQIRRFTGEITEQSIADERAKAAEEKRIDSLKDKYYEMLRIRRELQDAIIAAPPGTDTTGAFSMLQSMNARIGRAKMAINNGGYAPASVDSADADEFFRNVKQETKNLTAANDAYNRSLATTQSIQQSLQKTLLDTESQRRIATIRKQTIEESALRSKEQEIRNLINEVNQDRLDFESGAISSPKFTRDEVTNRLEAIQRRYNEELARGKQLQKDDADAKNRNAAASRKAAEAIQMLSHVNQGLISSYNRVAEAGSRARGVTVQIQQQLAGYAGLYGIERILKSVITIGGQFEFQHKALQNILGDIQAANTLFSQLQDLAIESPKTFMELTSYTKQLAAYQIPAGELFDTTKRLADLSSGLGVDMSRLILAFGQVRSAAVLRGQELRQFTEAGIPMVQALANEFTKLNGRVVTTGEVFELISKRAVPFEMVKKVLWDMTSEGGQFYNMQSELADTLYGKWQKLQDQWQITLGHIADANRLSGMFLKTALEGIVTLAASLDNILPMLSMFGIGKLTKRVGASTKSFMESGDTKAMNTMLIAKNQEALRLEKERLWYGKKLNDEERRLVANKNQLVASDYQLLAAENKISAKKAQQLLLDGKIEKAHFYRLLQMQGYTREQRKQIANNILMGNTSANDKILRGSSALSKFASNAWSMIGGWWGAAFAAAGGIISLYSNAMQKSSEAADMGKGAANDMLSSLNQANALYNEMSKKTPTDTAGYESAINKMTYSLKENGRYTDELREKTENANLSEKYNILLGELQKVSDEYLRMKVNVEAYLKSANQVGGGNWFTKIFNDPMSKDIKDWSEANIEKRVSERGLDRIGATLKVQLTKFYKDINEWNEDEMKDLGWSTLFGKLPDFQKTKFSNELYNLSKDRSLPEHERDFWEEAKESVNEYISAIKNVKGAEEEVDNQMQKYSDKIFVALEDRAKIFHLDWGNMDKWDDKSIKQLSDWINDIVNSYNVDEETARKLRQKIINALPSTVVWRFSLIPEEDNSGLSDWQKSVQKFFDDNKIHVPVTAQSSLESIEKDLKNKRKELQEKMKVSGGILISVGLDLSNLPNSIDEFISKLPAWTQDVVRRAYTSYKEDKEEDSRTKKAETLGFNTTPKKTGSGKKADEVLKGWRERKKALDEYYKLYEEYSKYMSKEEAIKRINDTGLLRGQALPENIDDYLAVMKTFMDSIRSKVKGTERFSFWDSLVADFNKKEFEQKIKTPADEALKIMQEYITKRTSQWNLYKQILDKTGSKEMAQNAFSDTRIFDDAARELEKKLSEVSGGNILDYNATQVAAEKYYKDNKEAYELWKKIVDLTSNNWTNALSKGADAYASLLSVSEKIKKNEEEIARLRKEGAGVPGNEARIMALQKENDKLSYEQFQQSSDYLRFFGSVLTMTTSEVEKTAQTIKNRLITELSRGNINARQYTKSLKEVNDQLTKSRTVLKGVKGAFLTGGQQGVVDYREQEVNNASLRVEAAQKELDAIKKREAAGEAVSASDKALAELKLSNAKTELANATKALGISLQAYTTLSRISMAISIIKGAFEGFSKIGHTLAETLEAFGNDDTAADWETMGDTFDAMNKALAPIDNVVGNLMKGNISGALGSAISAPVDMITGPMVAFAKMHDKQLQREIEASQARQKELENLTKNLERVLDRTLGGVYNTKASQEDRNKLLLYEARNNFGKKLSLFSGGNMYGYLGDDTLKAIGRALETETYYDTKLAELMLQRDEVKKQMQAEEDKKDSDGNAIEDYKNQIAELDDEIKHFAQDMAKALYDIDVKSWASELGDALFDAWKKGEDAAEAWKKKVGEIIADVSKNIIVTKMIETAFKPVEDYIVKMMTENSGMLDPLSFANGLIPLLDTAYNDVSGTLSTTLDAIEAVLQKNGMTMKDSSSSTASKVIQGGFTENETGLLLSYVNAIRADVSINRYTLEQIMMAVQGQAEMPSIASAQLAELRTIASNTRRNADFAADIYDILKKAQTGVQGLKVV